MNAHRTVGIHWHEDIIRVMVETISSDVDANPASRMNEIKRRARFIGSNPSESITVTQSEGRQKTVDEIEEFLTALDTPEVDHQDRLARIRQSVFETLPLRVAAVPPRQFLEAMCPRMSQQLSKICWPWQGPS